MIRASFAARGDSLKERTFQGENEEARKALKRFRYVQPITGCLNMDVCRALITRLYGGVVFSTKPTPLRSLFSGPPPTVTPMASKIWCESSGPML